jgi:hypothetical protein
MPRFDDSSARWDAPSATFAPTASEAINAVLGYPTVRAELIWRGRVVPASGRHHLGLAGPVPPRFMEPTE